MEEKIYSETYAITGVLQMDGEHHQIQVTFLYGGKEVILHQKAMVDSKELPALVSLAVLMMDHYVVKQKRAKKMEYYERQVKENGK